MINIYFALAELKRQIEEMEEDLKTATGYYQKLSLKNSIEWLFERGIALIKFCEPTNEEKKEILDYFQSTDKKQTRPDVIEFNRILDKIENGKPLERIYYRYLYRRSWIHKD